MNFTPANIKVVPILDIPPDEELPDLDNLYPEEEKALDEKVNKTLEVLDNALGGMDDLDDEEGDEDEDGDEDGDEEDEDE